MNNGFGEKVNVKIFGRSHAPEIGAVLRGIPEGIFIDEERLSAFMQRRRASGDLATKRHEEDRVHFLSGVENGFTTGGDIKLVIRNKDTRSEDYKNVAKVPRPSHADFAAFMKYGDDYDFRGGGQFSGRLTAATCAAGFIALEILREKGISVISHVSRIGNVEDKSLDDMREDKVLSEKLKTSSFPVIDEGAKEKMTALILEKKACLDSVGGEIECAVYNLPKGLGADFFGGLEALIARTIFSIPAVKGLEFGRGFEFSSMCGSEANDNFTVENGEVKTLTNNCGGILGGISSGMPITFRAAFKPTPSIGIIQKSVDLDTLEETELTINGRHDPCIVSRASAVVEASVALALINADGFTL